MFNWITDLLRSLVWSIAHGSLIVSDWLMDLMQLTFGINLGENQSLWVFFRVVLVILTILTPIFAFIYYFKWLEESEKTEFEGEKMLKRLLKVALTVVLLPTIFTFMMMFAQKTDEWTSNWLGYNEKFTPSEMILTNTATATIQSDYNEIKNNDTAIKLDDFDINKKAEGQDETYEYYNGWVELFFGVAIAIAMIYIMFMNFIPFAIRFILIIFKVILAPVPLGLSIIPTSSSYDDWLKGLSVDVMLNAVQLFALKVTLILFGVSGLFKGETSLIRAIFLLIALYASSQVPNVFAGFFNLNDQQANATLKAGMQVRGLKGMVKGAIGLGALGAGAFGNTLGGAGAFGGQKIGQLLGGDSLNELNEKGILPQNNPFNASAKGFGTSVATNNLNNTNKEEESEQSTTNEGLSKNPSNTFTSNQTSSPENLYTNPQEKDKEDEQQAIDPIMRITKEGSKARSFADKVETMGGMKGSIGRGISRSSKHAYLSMASRADRTFARNVSKRFTQDPLQMRNPIMNTSQNQSNLKDKTTENNDRLQDERIAHLMEERDKL